MKWEEYNKETKQEEKKSLFDRQIALDTAYRSEIIYMSLNEAQVKLLEETLIKLKTIK